MSCSSVRTIVNRATPSARRSISSSASSSLYRGPTHPQTVHSDGKPPKPLRMLFFGKPGAGKGTLSARMVAKYDVIQLSTGDLLRSHIAERTEVGKAAEAIVARGGLLPDDIITRVITSKLDTVKHRNWILDGFPRTLGQGKLLQEHLLKSKTPLTLVVNIEVPDKIILDRIGGRWVHLPSGRVYNTQFNPPKVPGRDDITGEELIQRPDDNPEVFAKRLKAFYESTAPLLSFYSSLEKQSNAAKLVTIAGNTSDEIWPQLEAILVNDLNMKPRTQRASSVREAMIRDASRMPQQQQNPLTNLSMTK